MTPGAGDGHAPGSGVRVWAAGADEAWAVAGLLIEFRDWLGRDFPSEESLHADVERLIEEGQADYLLAAGPADDAPAAGVCQLRYRYGVWLAAEDCWLEDLFVRDSVRGAGLGHALVAAAVGRARRRGCRRVELDTTSDNEGALALYERFGFSSAAPNGATSLLMRLRFAEPG